MALPHLAPGLRVVRRGLDQLQVGLYDGHRVVLPRTEPVQRALSLLLEQRGAGDGLDDDPALVSVLDRLDQHGLLVHEPADRPYDRVAVIGDLGVDALPDVADLLRAAGVATTPSPAAAAAVVVLSAGELDRDRLDPLVRRGTSHLVVRLVDGGAVLGPFVVPGTTACLRCIDAHQGVRDPDHVAVTTRYVRATARARPDGVPDVDPVLATLAAAWAVRDVVAHLRGREPATWSRTVTLAPTPARNHELEWSLHPRCGCCW